MSLITVDEIQSLYKKCGAYQDNYQIRTTINKGTLNNKLNACQISDRNNTLEQKVGIGTDFKRV